METTELKVQIEGLKKDVENVANLNARLDVTIDKLTDISSSIKSMLAVHEEKISRQEQIDEIIFDKLKKHHEKIEIFSAFDKLFWICSNLNATT